MPKGARPAPNTYLETDYIKNHLNKFDYRVVRISTREKYIQYGTYRGSESYVMPKSEFDKICIKTGENIEQLETRLGFNPGELGDNPAIASFKRSDLGEIKIPSGNEKQEQMLTGYQEGKLQVGFQKLQWICQIQIYLT